MLFYQTSIKNGCLGYKDQDGVQSLDPNLSLLQIQILTHEIHIRHAGVGVVDHVYCRGGLPRCFEKSRHGNPPWEPTFPSSL